MTHENTHWSQPLHTAIQYCTTVLHQLTSQAGVKGMKTNQFWRRVFKQKKYPTTCAVIDCYKPCSWGWGVDISGWHLMWTARKVALLGKNHWMEEGACWKILTKKMSASLGTVRLETRNILEKCSWPLWSTAVVPRNQKHPEIPPISTKPRDCKGNLLFEKVENTLEKPKIVWKNRNLIIYWLLQVKNRKLEIETPASIGCLQWWCPPLSYVSMT